MNKKLREIELYPLMKEWFVKQGYQVRPEYFMMQRFDAIAVKDNIVIAIEMKMTLSRVLYIQIRHGYMFADFRYAVVATNPKKFTDIFKQMVYEGIGVLSIKNNEVREIISPIKNNEYLEQYHREAIKYVEQSEDKGVGGKPQLKGEGPAQYVWKLIQEYCLKHPKATWKELYKEIPNHYCSYRSMQSAMSMLQQRICSVNIREKLKEKNENK